MTSTLHNLAQMDETPDVKRVVADMMRENTGRSLIDSGGTPQYDDDGNYVGSKQGYGRNHERNANKELADFENAAPSVMDFQGDVGDAPQWVGCTVNLFHWLTRGRLEFTETAHAISKAFYAWGTNDENERTGWYPLMNEFVGGGGGFNSYNSENNLSQTIQGILFEIEGPLGYVDEREPEDAEFEMDGAIYRAVPCSDIYTAEYVLLQVHGGTDVRGGYTAPVVFEIPEHAEGYLFMWSDCHADCSECSASWWSDDCGYHWYDGGDISEEWRVVEATDRDRAIKHVDCGGTIDVRGSVDV